jgi:HSP20 family molecular chaperone IbpA
MGDFIENFYGDLGRFTIKFPNFDSDFEKINDFELEDGIYTKVYDIPKEVEQKDIDITIDDDKKTITILYKYDKNGTNFNAKIVETLPNDTDYRTFNANIKNDVLTITFKQLFNNKPDTNIKIKFKAVD